MVHVSAGPTGSQALLPRVLCPQEEGGCEGAQVVGPQVLGAVCRYSFVVACTPPGAAQGCSVTLSELMRVTPPMGAAVPNNVAARSGAHSMWAACARGCRRGSCPASGPSKAQAPHGDVLRAVRWLRPPEGPSGGRVRNWGVAGSRALGAAHRWDSSAVRTSPGIVPSRPFFIAAPGQAFTRDRGSVQDRKPQQARYVSGGLQVLSPSAECPLSCQRSSVRSRQQNEEAHLLEFEIKSLLDLVT
ncbi:hypothetical protein NDU88_003914 [Pleurodeles waltl]|uniref:Uncharacterized protein n=1 Tax=Pleurodeles waltl TaxID=8319 RepID=A0AAV7QDD5_PLEWA|nr:hypothetical protein NDU88_003914 [Pleurodeles waltl]